jgi:two-component system, LytTR family, sensor histidine kinase AgrC
MALLYLFIKVALLAVFMICLTPLRDNSKKTYAVIVVGNVFIWLFNYLIYEIKGLVFLDHVFLLSASLPAYICFSLVAKYKGAKVLFSLLTVSIFGMLSAFLSFLPTLIFHHYVVDAFFNSLCYALIIVFIIKVFRKPYFRIMEALENGWGPFCFVTFLMLAIIFLLQYYPEPIANSPDNIPLLCLTYILMFAFYAIVYLNFENITQYYQLKQDKRLMRLQTEMQKKEYDAILDKLSAAQIYRHDMKHHINALNTLLRENNLGEAEKYLGKLSDRLNDTVIEQYCENYVVNVILSSYISKAKEEGIEVTCKADVPADLKMEELELGAIFSNAMDNAIAACGKIEDRDHRKISVACRVHINQIYIQISNTFAGEVSFDGEYPVSQREGHGFGTRSIAAIAQKYGGIFSFTAEEGLFTTTVILNLTA